MTERKRGLGRNLESLLGGYKDNAAVLDQPNDSPLSTESSVANESRITSENRAAFENHPGAGTRADHSLRHVPIEWLHRSPYQPRHYFDEETLDQLAQSMKHQGMMQPIVARIIGDNRYEIIAGERRWRAAQRIGMSEVPVIIRQASDQDAMAMALIENIQRNDLNVIEEAAALKRLADEYSMTHEEIADIVGRSRTAVTNLLRLLSLPTDVKALLEKNELEMGHARALLSLPAEQQSSVAQTIANKNMSVRATEKWIRLLQNPQQAANQTAHQAVDPNIKRLEIDLSEKLGATVALDHQTNGKGKVVISYSSLDQLDGILARIQ